MIKVDKNSFSFYKELKIFIENSPGKDMTTINQITLTRITKFPLPSSPEIYIWQAISPFVTYFIKTNNKATLPDPIWDEYGWKTMGTMVPRERPIDNFANLLRYLEVLYGTKEVPINGQMSIFNPEAKTREINPLRKKQLFEI